MTSRQTIADSPFDFLQGRWTIRHRRLTKLFVGSDKWTRFETEYEYTSLLGGLANIDRTWGLIDGAYFEGASLRTLEPETGIWTIYWMDSRQPRLREQVRGPFDGKRGEFFGEDSFEGKPMPLRFVWERPGENLARWEQAYRHPETGEWETNWTMDFTR